MVKLYYKQKSHSSAELNLGFMSHVYYKRTYDNNAVSYKQGPLYLKLEQTKVNILRHHKHSSHVSGMSDNKQNVSLLETTKYDLDQTELKSFDTPYENYKVKNH